MCHFFFCLTQSIEDGRDRCVFTYVTVVLSERASSLCPIASSLIVPSPLPSLGSPSERYLSQIALRPHVRPAYLRPPFQYPNVSFFGFFRSIVPSFPPPWSVRSFRTVGLSSCPIPSTCPKTQLYANTFPPSLPIRPSPPLTRSDPLPLIRTSTYSLSVHVLIIPPSTS